MSYSRLKNLAIAALILVNILFLTVIVMDSVDDARIERQAIENVCTFIRNAGIMIEPENVKTGGTIRTMRTSRGGETEAAIALAILGPTVMTDLAPIYQYENETRGIAEFASAGDFEIQVYNGVITSSGGALRVVQGILRNMKLETAGLTVSSGNGSEIVTAISAYRGASIFNCTIDFIFNDGDLQTVRGRYVTGVEPAEDGSENSRAGTALLDFLSAVRNEERDDIRCTRIESVEAGYLHSVVLPFGEGVIAPIWLITTDTGRYAVDGTTGEIKPF